MMLASACEGSASPLDLVFITPTPIVVTVERPVAQTVVLVQTATPVPTPTQPAFMGSRVEVDEGLANATRASIAALGADFVIQSFTQSGQSEPIVWVEDTVHPGTFLCGSPLYYPGLGSLLVLTTSNVYDLLHRQEIVQGQRGCVVISLQEGRESIQRILEYNQGLYDALRNRQRFDTSNQVDSYIRRFLQQTQNTGFAEEINLILVYMAGDDLSHTSVPLDCIVELKVLGDGQKLFPCVSQYFFRLTSEPFTLEGDSASHVALVYAEFQEFANMGSYFLFTGRGRQMREQAPASSLLRTEPYTTDEALLGIFGTGYVPRLPWQRTLFYGVRVAGLDTVARNFADDGLPLNNPYFQYVLPETGTPRTDLALSDEEQRQYVDFFSGRSEIYPFRVAEKVLQWDRKAMAESYLRVLILEDK